MKNAWTLSTGPWLTNSAVQSVLAQKACFHIVESVIMGILETWGRHEYINTCTKAGSLLLHPLLVEANSRLCKISLAAILASELTRHGPRSHLSSLILAVGTRVLNKAPRRHPGRLLSCSDISLMVRFQAFPAGEGAVLTQGNYTASLKGKKVSGKVFFPGREKLIFNPLTWLKPIPS